MYQLYKDARDKSWDTLIKCRINTLPVNLMVIARHYSIKIIRYSKSEYIKSLNISESDGFSFLRGQPIIYYNDSKPANRIRFTIAHELGHCFLGHLSEGKATNRHNNEADTYTDPQEVQANVFARDILMPATVLHSLNVQSAEEISNLCSVSMQSAEIRYKRLLELSKRGMYNRHPSERRVYEQFIDFIYKNKL